MSDWKKDLHTGLEAWKQILPQMRVDSNQAKESLIDLLESKEHTMSVVVFGEFKTGKSMFINAFLGEELSVSAATPTTAVTTEIKYGPKRKLYAVLQNGSKQEVDLAMFKELSTEHEGRLKAVRRQLDHLIIETPIEQLKEITIIDTPGFNSGNEHHDEMSKKYLGYGDYAIWIFHHNQVGTLFEKDTLMTLHEREMKVFGIVNAIDMHNEEDEETLENFMEYQRRQFRGLLESLTPVSSKEALQAKQEQNLELLEFSGWQAVESLFKEMEFSDVEKMERTLKKFVTVLKDAESLLASEKQTVPIHYYQHIIQTFMEEQMPELIQLFDKFHTRRISIQAELIKLEALISIPLDSEESIVKHKVLFNEMNEQHPFQRVTAFDWEAYIDLYIVIDAFNPDMRELEFDRNLISEKWDVINRKAFFKKNLLERLFMRQREYNLVLQKVNNEWVILKRQKNEMDALIDAYFRELKEDLLFIYNGLLKELVEMGQFWFEEWREREKELQNIPEEQEREIKRLESIMNAYHSSIVPFFKNPYEEIIQNETYQEAYYKSQVIETMYPEMPMELFGKSKNLFYAIEHLKIVQPVNVVHKNFIFQPLLNRSISFVPPVLALPFEAAIEKIKVFRRKIVFILGVIFWVVIAVWKIGFSSMFDRESEVSHAQVKVSIPYEEVESQDKMVSFFDASR